MAPSARRPPRGCGRRSSRCERYDARAAPVTGDLPGPDYPSPLTNKYTQQPTQLLRSHGALLTRGCMMPSLQKRALRRVCRHELHHIIPWLPSAAQAGGLHLNSTHLVRDGRTQLLPKRGIWEAEMAEPATQAAVRGLTRCLVIDAMGCQPAQGLCEQCRVAFYNR